MGGTRKGGLKAAATRKFRFGINCFEDMGRKGGAISRGGGFAGIRISRYAPARRAARSDGNERRPKHEL